LDAHADAHIFRSLPRAQALRAARLLAEIGDARGRFPTPGALASLAGVAPSTRQSGKSRLVGFRCAVDRQLRDALVEWPGDSRLSSPWAADVYGPRHPFSADAWIRVADSDAAAAPAALWPTCPNASPTPLVLTEV
jgi:hypothetical protein